MFIAAPSGVFLATLVMVISSTDLALSQMLEVLFVYTLIGSMLGLTVALGLGTPLYLIFKAYNIGSLWLYILGGILCALPFWLLWFFPFEGGHWQAYRYSNTVYFFNVGAFSAAIFWYLVARPLHSNKSNQSDAQKTRASV